MRERPNIILILTDHFRPDAVGSATPTLNRLAGSGVRFVNACCASPLCQPARVSIVTGRYPSQHGVCGNMATPVSEELRDDTFMNHLREAGYYTAMVGKHHYIDRYGLGYDLTEDDEEIGRYGFDYVFQVVDEVVRPGFPNNEDRYTKHLREKGLYDPYVEAVGSSAWRCGPFPFGEEDYDDVFIGREGCRFVREYDREEPFYLNLSFVGPHPPYWHPGELKTDPDAVPAPIGAPDTASVRQRRAHYLEKCRYIDRCIGELLDVLDERGVRENTLIIFTSDHGDNLGDHGIWDKRFFYRQSVGVPLILNGPGLPLDPRNGGRMTSKALVSHVDLYPTILGLAGVDAAGFGPRPGRDLIPVMNSMPGSSHPALFSQLATAEMIRTPNWKLVFDAEQDGVQFLFNLRSDPTEERNLAGVAGYERVSAELVERLLSHRIRLTQYTHLKEEQRMQRARVAGRE